MAHEMKFVRHTPLDAFVDKLAGASGDAVNLEPVALRSLVNLRGRVTEDFTAAIEAAVGVALPLEPNRWNGDGERAAIWLGPDEWLLVAPDGDAGTIEKAVRATCSNDPWLSVVDVSHNYTSLLASGTRVRDLFAKGCGLDLHPRAFGRGDCAQTLLARSRVILRVLDDETALEVSVRNSFARYTAEWLLDASAEFQPVR